MSWFKKISLLFAISLIGIISYQVMMPSKHSANLAQHQSAFSQLAQPPTGGDFTLTSQQGAVSLEQFRNQWVLLYFGYTFCPDICPTNLGYLSLAYRQLSEAQKAQVQILFVSVDPKRDTPATLAEYSDFFNSDMIGLTGDKASIDDITQRYGVVYAIQKNEQNPNHYSVDHSAFTYLINPQGKLVQQLPHGTNAKQFKQVIEQSLQQQTQ